MTKLNLITLSLLSLPVFATNFVIVIDEKENNYEVGGFTDSKDDPTWAVKSTSCSFDKEETDIAYGKEYLQTETCIENIERTVTTTRTYENGTTEIISSVKETDTNSLTPITQTITGTHLESSCKAFKDGGYSLGDGVYTINNSKNYKVYCDMTTHGGGWTMILAQFEADPATNWNEGIQSDYDPTLSTSKSFALNNSEIPTHSQISMSQTDYDGINVSDKYFNYVYTTGNISKTNIVEINSGVSYAIHRNSAAFFGRHDADASTSESNNPPWNNTLTIDLINDSVYGQFSYAFSPNHTTRGMRGYSYNGDQLQYADQSSAWLLWVR